MERRSSLFPVSFDFHTVSDYLELHTFENLYISISADGSTWKSYPKMADFIKQMTQDLVGSSIEVQFRTSFDGSAKGAAFIAAKHETNS